jgi:multiple sugar transport system ATP-binding protein
MADVQLRLDQVEKTYRSRGKSPVQAVQDLSLAVAPGEIIAFLGSSGCGKTSTLRMIAGFEDVTRGTIHIKNRRIDALAPAKRNVAMAFEGYSLYPPLTVRQNIGFALEARRLPKAQVQERVIDMARLLEIEDVLDRYPTSISGGQQQRASLGRALVREADLYLLDEPMGQLEPQLRAILRGRLKHYLRERRMTTVLVTHDQTEANALADRIAVMEGGVLQQFGTPADLKDRPVNAFVGTFIGEPPMNVYRARIRGSEGSITFALGQNGEIALTYPSAELSHPVRKTVLDRGEVILGVRPHAVRIGAGEHRLEVVSNQWLGDQSHVASDFAGATLVAVSQERIRARIGDRLPFAVRADDLHLFDPETGRALAHGPVPA